LCILLGKKPLLLFFPTSQVVQYFASNFLEVQLEERIDLVKFLKDLLKGKRDGDWLKK
jgi:hypothetical protein